MKSSKPIDWIECYYLNALIQETEIKLLTEKLEKLKTRGVTSVQGDSEDEIEKLISENTKLNYRINIMKRVKQFSILNFVIKQHELST